MESIKDLVSIYPGVIWEGDYQVQPFVMVGVPSGSNTEGLLETHIGVGALLRSHTVIYWGNKIGQNFQTGHGVLIREENEIGNDVSTGSGTIVEHHVKIGNRVRLHSHVFVPEFSILEDDCWLGPNVVLTNAKYPRSPQVKKNLIGPHIGKFAKIGANATILPGVRIEAYALIGAGAVVTKDVPEGAVVIGNPARIINYVSNLPYGDK
ncbi:MAG: acyltransferase [Dolichospermum sp.]|jgi:acetyltransferase-like isoleucine patch superfamily enzyme